MANSAPTALVPFEFDFDYTSAVSLTTGETVQASHVKYRTPGTRRWTKFLLCCEPGEGLQALDAKIEPAILAHAEGRI